VPEFDHASARVDKGGWGGLDAWRNVTPSVKVFGGQENPETRIYRIGDQSWIDALGFGIPHGEERAVSW